MRKDSKPVLIEFKTFRIKGHEEASGQAYIDESIIEKWAKKDPISHFELFLLKSKYLSKKEMDAINASTSKEIDQNWSSANSYKEVDFNIENELGDVYKEHNLLCQ